MKDQVYICPILHCHDPKLERLIMAAQASQEYKRLHKMVLTCKNVKAMKKFTRPEDPLRTYAPYWDDLSIEGELVIYHTDRIVVPQTERARLLKMLHEGHCGIVKTRALARQLYFWPSISRDIKDMISRCEQCFSLLPQQQQLPLQETVGRYPMEHTSSDLFQYANRHYLVLADRYSGMIWCDRLTSLNTDAVTAKLDKWMQEFGDALHIRTDGGPQYRSAFDSWCEDNGIRHETSSPYYPESNGHAENAVKTAKHLLIKVEGDQREFHRQLCAWRNVPNQQGKAPAEKFFGRRLRTNLPSLKSHSVVDGQTPLTKTTRERNYNARSRDLEPFQPGDLVASRTSNYHWDGRAEVLFKRREDGRSYKILLPDGNTTVRTRRQLRHAPPEL